MAPPAPIPLPARLPLPGPRPPRLRRLLRAGLPVVLHRLPPRRRRGRPPQRPLPPSGVRGGARLGRPAGVAPLHVPAGQGTRAGEHERRLHAAQPRRASARGVPAALRRRLLPPPPAGARRHGGGVRADGHQVHLQEAPYDPRHRRDLSVQRVVGVTGRGDPASAVAVRRVRRPPRRKVRRDGVRRRHELLPLPRPELGADGAVDGGEGGGASQVHGGGVGDVVQLHGGAGVHTQGRAQGRRAGAGGGGGNRRCRALHPPGEAGGCHRAHLRLHQKVLTWQAVHVIDQLNASVITTGSMTV